MIDLNSFSIQLSVDIKLPSNRKYNMELDLAHAVATDECITKVLSTKVNIFICIVMPVRRTV